MNYNIQSRRQNSLILSVKFFALTLILVLLYTTILFAQTTVYIDPANSGDPGQDGSLDHPWDSWSDFGFQDNTTYLMKKGTSESLATHINMQGKSNITLSTYGTGERPYLYQGGTNTYVIRIHNSHHIVLEGYKMEMPIGAGGGNVYIGASGTGENFYTWVIDCEVVGGWRGINAEVFAAHYDAQIGNVYVHDCHVYNQNSDGVFCKTNTQSTFDTVVVSGCHIHDVNLKWYSDHEAADGDPVHLLRVNNFLVENNILDKRGTAKKFCFIWGGGTFDNEKGVVRYNTMYPPDDHDTYSSNAIYVGSYQQHALDSLHFYGNKIIGRGYDSGNHAAATGLIRSSYINMSYNLFDSVGTVGLSYLYCDHADVHNNTFRFIDRGWGHLLSLNGISASMKNNIFLMPPGSELIDNATNAVLENNIELYSSDLQGFDDVLHFADIDNFNYHLTENSTPVRNQGIEYSGALDCDADSIPVPMEGIRDIGVFEYISGTQTNISSFTLNDELKHSIYPNPAADHLYFDLKNLNDKPVEITISSVNGQTIFQEVYHSHNKELTDQLDLSNLSKGMYIIYFQNGTISKFDKFIKF